MLCYYAECRILFIIMLNVIMLSVVMLSVVIQSVVAPIMPSIITFNVVMLSVAPWRQLGRGRVVSKSLFITRVLRQVIKTS
jgi:hypothetical protein